MRENGVGEPSIGRASQHRHLHYSHDFAGCGADHREAKNVIVILPDKNFHEALSLAGRLRPQHRIHRQSRDADDNALAFRIAFTQSNMRERRISKHAVWDQPVVRAAISSAQIVPNNAKIVLRDVRELWAAGAFPDRPDVSGGCFEALIDADVAATIHLNTDLLEADAGGVGNTTCRNQNVATLDLLIA